MSAVAFALDLGNQNCTITKVIRGGVDCILNEASKRQNPVIVSYSGNERFLGEAATTQVCRGIAGFYYSALCYGVIP